MRVQLQEPLRKYTYSWKHISLVWKIASCQRPTVEIWKTENDFWFKTSLSLSCWHVTHDDCLGRPMQVRLHATVLLICEQAKDENSKTIHICLDVAIAQWMKDNFSKGIYPSLAQWKNFAETYKWQAMKKFAFMKIPHKKNPYIDFPLALSIRIFAITFEKNPPTQDRH